MTKQIIEGLRAAKHQHAACCYTPEGIMCICLANQHNTSIDAAIAELEKQPAEQVPVAWRAWDDVWIRNWVYTNSDPNSPSSLNDPELPSWQVTWEPLYLHPSTAKEAPADVLAVLDELEKIAIRSCSNECTINFEYMNMPECTCGTRNRNAMLEHRFAKLRSLLGGEV